MCILVSTWDDNYLDKYELLSFHYAVPADLMCILSTEVTHIYPVMGVVP